MKIVGACRGSSRRSSGSRCSSGTVAAESATAAAGSQGHGGHYGNSGSFCTVMRHDLSLKGHLISDGSHGRPTAFFYFSERSSRNSRRSSHIPPKSHIPTNTDKPLSRVRAAVGKQHSGGALRKSHIRPQPAGTSSKIYTKLRQLRAPTLPRPAESLIV